MVDHTPNLDPGFVNFSSFSFHRWARHYYKCFQDFQSPDNWSPVPYALLARAIELELKARHLELTPGQPRMKEFGHDLEAAYEALPAAQKILTTDEREVLRMTSEVYTDEKGFDYIKVSDAVTAYSRFPDLATLDALARRLLDSGITKTRLHQQVKREAEEDWGKGQ
jgi:hypothetical protein